MALSPVTDPNGRRAKLTTEIHDHTGTSCDHSHHSSQVERCSLGNLWYQQLLFASQQYILHNQAEVHPIDVHK